MSFIKKAALFIRSWVLVILVIVLSTVSFVLSHRYSNGALYSSSLRKSVIPTLELIRGYTTDLKFKIRGAQPPKNKVVIVEIDGLSLNNFGRWPWHRDLLAHLVQNIFASGAKVVGLDLVLSEKDERVPVSLARKLENKFGKPLVDQIAQAAETDPAMIDVIKDRRQGVVLAWMTEAACQPLFSKKDDCPVGSHDLIQALPQGFNKFSISQGPGDLRFNRLKTPVWSAPTILANIPDFQNAALHSGFVNVALDPDGRIRKEPAIMMVAGLPFPSLSLEMARLAIDDVVEARFDLDHGLRDLFFRRSLLKIPASPTGEVEINFRGPAYTFKYVSAADMLSDNPLLEDPLNHKLKGQRKETVFKDALVLVGLTALGVFDMRSFPTGANVPGVEGHATVLDNILSNDLFQSHADLAEFSAVIFLMTLGALGFAILTKRLEAVKALVLFALIFLIFGYVDVGIFFSHSLNWNTGFLYSESIVLFVIILAQKYMKEEAQKKFVRSAFSRYVAPAVVDAIIKDPAKLSLGGERRHLSVMFSDIRGFTTFSEQMDAKTLSSFLNEYFEMMNGIIFKNRGTLDKYIGDSIMAFWGAPVEEPRHAFLACKTAVEMIHGARGFKDKAKKKWGIELDMGVGFAAGLVSVGNMGTPHNFSYTVIGDTVNLSSRLEGATKQYGVPILTTRQTVTEAQAKEEVFPFRSLDLVKLKGKKQAVEIVELAVDPPPPEAFRLFDEARALYLSCQWDLAIEMFEKVNNLYKNNLSRPDRPCEIFIDRCKMMKKVPPIPGWDGGHQLESK